MKGVIDLVLDFDGFIETEIIVAFFQIVEIYVFVVVGEGFLCRGQVRLNVSVALWLLFFDILHLLLLSF